MRISPVIVALSLTLASFEPGTARAKPKKRTATAGPVAPAVPASAWEALKDREVTATTAKGEKIAGTVLDVKADKVVFAAADGTVNTYRMHEFTAVKLATPSRAAEVRELPAEPAPSATPAGPNSESGPSMRVGVGLTTSGAILTTIGVSGLATLIAGLVLAKNAQRDVEALNPSDPGSIDETARLDEQGALGNRLTLAGAGLTLAALPAGLIMMPVGIVLLKRARQHGRGTARLRVLPVARATYGGLHFTLQF
jgi:hypothetical protein